MSDQSQLSKCSTVIGQTVGHTKLVTQLLLKQLLQQMFIRAVCASPDADADTLANIAMTLSSLPLNARLFQLVQ